MEYSTGKIYCLICNISGKKYYGSTICPLWKRLDDHKQGYKCNLRGLGSYVMSFDIIKNNDYRIELVEKVNCSSKEELLIREKFHIQNNECVNKYIPLRTHEEYYLNHKEKMNQKSRENYKKNKEHYKKKMKEWIQKNKDTEHFKEMIKKNKAKQKEIHGTITCNCGSVVKNFTWDINRHELTKKHQKYLTTISTHSTIA
jgi:hypothetical protein